MQRFQNFFILFFFIQQAIAQPAWQPLAALSQKDSVANWSLHVQNTTVLQLHPGYHVHYSGLNSLDEGYESATSNTTTFYVGRKLWKNASFFFNEEITAGNGLSKTRGVAGFPNGEIYRVGSPAFTPFVARAYLQQIIPLKKSSFKKQSTDQNQLAGNIPSSRIVITAGKFCISDFFDDNKYNHDARSQFLNWSLMAQGAWDFPADVRGYTSGLVVELINTSWALRFASVQVPKLANGLSMEYKLSKASSHTIEIEKHWQLKNNLPGAFRTTAFVTFSKAPYYKDAVRNMALGDSSLNDIIEGNTEATNYNGAKYGFGFNLEQALNKTIGVFARYSWNDGQTASWAFTEIDRSLQAGFEISSFSSKRKTDVAGIAVVANNLSQDHKNYLAAGGYGFIIGDGKLNYGTETIFETYYRFQLTSFLQLSVNYQLILNPAYNKDRPGPVHVPSIRLHVEL
jgi:hypothetical protein